MRASVECSATAITVYSNCNSKQWRLCWREICKGMWKICLFRRRFSNHFWVKELSPRFDGTQIATIENIGTRINEWKRTRNVRSLNIKFLFSYMSSTKKLNKQSKIFYFHRKMLTREKQESFFLNEQQTLIVRTRFNQRNFFHWSVFQQNVL